MACVRRGVQDFLQNVNFLQWLTEKRGVNAVYTVYHSDAKKDKNYGRLWTWTPQGTVTLTFWSVARNAIDTNVYNFKSVLELREMYDEYASFTTEVDE